MEWVTEFCRSNVLMRISEILFWIIIHQRLLDTDVKRDALELAKAGQWDDAGPDQAIAQGGAGGGTLANSQVSFYKL